MVSRSTSSSSGFSEYLSSVKSHSFSRTPHRPSPRRALRKRLRFQAVAAAVADDRLEETLYVSPAGPIAALDVLFGYRPAIRDGNVFMMHRTGFTAKTLRQKLEASGFGDVRVEREGFDLWAAGYKPVDASAVSGAVPTL